MRSSAHFRFPAACLYLPVPLLSVVGPMLVLLVCATAVAAAAPLPLAASSPPDVNARFDCPASSCWCGEAFENATIRHISAQYVYLLVRCKCGCCQLTGPTSGW